MKGGRDDFLKSRRGGRGRGRLEIEKKKEGGGDGEEEEEEGKREGCSTRRLLLTN